MDGKLGGRAGSLLADSANGRRSGENADGAETRTSSPLRWIRHILRSAGRDGRGWLYGWTPLGVEYLSRAVDPDQISGGSNPKCSVMQPAKRAGEKCERHRASNVSGKKNFWIFNRARPHFSPAVIFSHFSSTRGRNGASAQPCADW